MSDDGANACLKARKSRQDFNNAADSSKPVRTWKSCAKDELCKVRWQHGFYTSAAQGSSRRHRNGSGLVYLCLLVLNEWCSIDCFIEQTVRIVDHSR